MSPKKKPTPTKSAPKDDLIDALFESDSEGRGAPSDHNEERTDSDSDSNVSRLSDVRRPHPASAKRPPPPPPPDDSDRIYNFDDDVTRGGPSVEPQAYGQTRDDDVYDASKDDTNGMARLRARAEQRDSGTLSIVRNPVNPNSIPSFDAPSKAEADRLELEDIKTVVHAVGRDHARSDQSQTNSKHGVSRLSQSGNYKNVAEDVDNQAPAKPVARVEKGGDKLQKLEEVLRRLTPQFSAPQASGKAKGPLYDSETAAKAVVSAKAANQKSLDDLAPPPVKPVGVVAKAIYSGTNSMNTDSGPERAPTEPVRASIDPHIDEKTVAAPQSAAPMHRAGDSNQPRPMWQDAKTEVLSQMTTSDNPDADREAEQFMPTEIRANSPGARFREEARQAQPGAAIFSSSEAALRQSENLRVAQKRISELENELERVRRENENLRSAGETLRRRTDELQAHAENAELNTQEAKKIAEEERKVLKGQIQSRDREISEMKSRIDDAENRLESNFRKIRVRERDLEHRIEIIKAESQSIAASKDRMILELKRQIDQISSELNHSKAQVQETFNQYKDKQETARRAVRALRIALTVLEGEEKAE